MYSITVPVCAINVQGKMSGSLNVIPVRCGRDEVVSQIAVPQTVHSIIIATSHQSLCLFQLCSLFHESYNAGPTRL